MLAREHEEFELYEEFDRMRYEEEKHIYQNFDYNINYRLMPVDEVPDWVKVKRKVKKPILGRRRNYRDFYNVSPDIDESSESEKRSKRRATQRMRRNRRNKKKAAAKKASNNLLANQAKNANGGKDAENGNSVKKVQAKQAKDKSDDIFVDSDD